MRTKRKANHILRPLSTPPAGGTPSEEEIQLFSNLPPDIVRVIFEKAMEFRPIPIQLALVSREVRTWVEPCMYQHLSFSWSSESTFNLFYRTFRGRRQSPSKGVNSYRHNVKGFFASGPNGHSERMRAVVRELIGPESLIFLGGCWGVLDALLDSCSKRLNIRISSGVDDCQEFSGTGSRDGELRDPYAHKHLRQLGLDSFLFFDHDLTFTHRIFRDLTHLILDFFYIDLPWDTLRNLSSLTHLAFNCIDDSEQVGLEYCITLLLDACPANLLVLIVKCIHFGNEDFDLIDSEQDYIIPKLPFETWNRRHPMLDYYSSTELDELHLIARMALGRVDPRLVVGCVTRLPENHLFQNEVIQLSLIQDWDEGLSNGGGHWSIAESIIEKRRGRTGNPVVSWLSESQHV